VARPVSGGHQAAQNGLKLACVDACRNRDGSSALGGTCLNAGCIPSKALLESSELWHRAQHEFGAHGIKVDGLALDLAAMQKRRAAIVRTMTGGIASLFKAAGVTAIFGKGRLLADRVVEVAANDGKTTRLTARHVVLASGSVPTELKSLPFDGTHIIDSWGALELEAVPRKLCVIGAGVIGLELGSVWRRLGAEVVTLEALDAAYGDVQLAEAAGTSRSSA
jgi:dihydrolipoamide dehydrogenase